MLDKQSQGSVLITGAGQRIGRAIAKHLAHYNWPIIVHYHNSSEAARSLVEEINHEGGKAACIKADLSKSEAILELVYKANTMLTPLVALINNASVFEYDDCLSVTEESWDRHIDLNLRAPLFLMQAFTKALQPDSQGAIVNIIDQRVWKLTPQFLSYTISKSGLWTLTQTLAQALAPRIRVNAVGPGPVLANIHQTSQDFEAEARAVLLERAVSPQEIAETTRFLLESPSITGQMIAVDSGQHLAWKTPDIVENYGG